MSPAPALAGLLALLLASCAQLSTRDQRPWSPYLPPPSTAAPNLIQGVVGLTEFDEADMFATDPSVVVRDSGVSTFPMLGGSMQHVLSDGDVQVGVEGGFTFGWDSDTTTIAVGNGTIVTERDNDVFLLDGFVGIYVNVPMRHGWRIYGGTGPVLQYGSVELEYLDPASEPTFLDEDGVGGGWYARAGFEIDFGEGTLIGLGVRWIDTYVDLGGGLRDLDLQGVQAGLTVSRAY